MNPKWLVLSLADGSSSPANILLTFSFSFLSVLAYLKCFRVDEGAAKREEAASRPGRNVGPVDLDGKIRQAFFWVDGDAVVRIPFMHHLKEALRVCPIPRNEKEIVNEPQQDALARPEESETSRFEISIEKVAEDT